ncbi:MAG: hypothetical protein Q8P55_01695, partial [bacterium]|nr:hypothetical protein [bacterium]
SFGSNYYAYEVVYQEMVDEPNTQLCSPLVGSVVASNKNNITLGTSYPTNLQCFGSYTLKVLGCIDTDNTKTQCIEQGEVASHTFTIGASSAPTGFGGLVPCGRENFNGDTPWDDREPCGIQHIFLGLWTLLNFVLWRLTPILLVLGTMATGAVLYFLSYNAPELLAQIKSGWKAFGVGVLIMLFSWFLLNLLLGLLGFDVTIFGRWYEVVF